MCYGPESRPPLPPVSGGASSGREMTLRSADGAEFSVFSATADSPASGRTPGIVILPDVRGLHAFYHELAVQFASAGIHAIAIDYFGRTAGIGTRGDDFDFMSHIPQTTADNTAADVKAAIDHIRSPDGGGAQSVFTVGFCFGGRNSFNQAARGHGLAGVIGFYGRLSDKRFDGDSPPPSELASSYECPVLGLFGGDDPGIPDGEVADFRQALNDAGVVNEMVIYQGAPHSFFDRFREKFATESEDSWRRILDFIKTNS